MKFFIELNDEENMFANEKIYDAFLYAKNGYIQPASNLLKNKNIKFNLEGCLVNALYIKEGKTVLEFIPDMID